MLNRIIESVIRNGSVRHCLRKCAMDFIDVTRIRIKEDEVTACYDGVNCKVPYLWFACKAPTSTRSVITTPL